jgi:glutaconate CoA-transferase subunit B
MTPHQRRRFPARLDFCTSAGNLDGRASRQATGVRGAGPQAVVTDLGILEPDETGELLLAALHPGVSVEQARSNTGWALKTSPNLKYTQPPLPEELRILREELDPQGIYL